MQAPKDVRVERSKYTFRELHAWKAALFAPLFANEAVESLDVDEMTGRIKVGLSRSGTEGSILELASVMKVPSESLELSVEGRNVLTLQRSIADRQRPLRGGFQVGPRGCTMTIPVMRSGRTEILTNSHCSAQPWSLDGGPTSQPIYTTQYGQERTDPSPYFCGSAFWWVHCRRADVAAFSLEGLSEDVLPGDEYPFGVGQLVRLGQQVSGLAEQRGSLYVDMSQPAFYVAGTYEYPLQGEQLEKSGVTSG